MRSPMPGIAVDTWSAIGPLMVTLSEPSLLRRLADVHRSWLEEALLCHGALAFRNAGIGSADAFGVAAGALCGALSDYVYRSTVRTHVGNRVFTATEYPATAEIPMHNENSYQRRWPLRLAFACLQRAASGGETPLAWGSSVTQRIDPKVLREFAERDVMYVRNYGHGVDLSWQTTFQTTSEKEVEEYCRAHGIAWQWLDENRLRTTQVCPAVIRHPLTGHPLWFNQAHLFHVSALGAENARALLEIFDVDDLPRHARFGDGGQIAESLLDDIRAAYAEAAVCVPWENGDAWLLDNRQVAHGRRPYTGFRRVLVAMSEDAGTHDCAEQTTDGAMVP